MQKNIFLIIFVLLKILYDDMNRMPVIQVKTSCFFYCTKRTYHYAFLSLYNVFGNRFDHGMISSSRSSVNFFSAILVRIYSIYSYGFSLFIFALSMILYAAPLAFAPLILFENRKFFRPITKLLQHLSAELLLISTRPSSI